MRKSHEKKKSAKKTLAKAVGKKAESPKGVKKTLLKKKAVKAVKKVVSPVTHTSHAAPAASILSTEKPHVVITFIRTTFGGVRTLIVWALSVVSVFAILSLLASQSNNESATTLLQEMPQASVLSSDDASSTDSINIIATGDIMPARFVEKRMRALNDYTYPFQNVAEFLKSGDITFGNLETPLLPGKNVITNSMVFRADQDITKGLSFAGFDVMSVANNHAMNYQVPGLTSTLQALRKANIAYTGGGKNTDAAHTPAIITVKGKKVAFYAYNDPAIPPGYHGEATPTKPGIAAMDIETVKADVQNALKEADFVVVSMHSGREYRKNPTQFQKDFAHAAIDAGASVVIGAHPHVVQPIEYYKNGIIFYSLGNFVFDQFFSDDVKNGLAVKIALPLDKSADAKPSAELFPVRLDTIQPRILDGQERTDELKKLGF